MQPNLLWSLDRKPNELLIFEDKSFFYSLENYMQEWFWIWVQILQINSDGRWSETETRKMSLSFSRETAILGHQKIYLWEVQYRSGFTKKDFYLNQILREKMLNYRTAMKWERSSVNYLKPQSGATSANGTRLVCFPVKRIETIPTHKCERKSSARSNNLPCWQSTTNSVNV